MKRTGPILYQKESSLADLNDNLPQDFKLDRRSIKTSARAKLFHSFLKNVNSINTISGGFNLQFRNVIYVEKDDGSYRALSSKEFSTVDHDLEYKFHKMKNEEIEKGKKDSQENEAKYKKYLKQVRNLVERARAYGNSW